MVSFPEYKMLKLVIWLKCGKIKHKKALLNEESFELKCANMIEA